MDQNNNQKMELTNVFSPEVVSMQATFAMAVQSAQNLQITDNACAAFETVAVVTQLRQALTDEMVKQVFMPLMNTKLGFRTDKDPNRPTKSGTPVPYSEKVVKDCLIDAICIGLMPTGNQFNIIAGNMYPTKEGYTALLKKIGCKYFISVGQDNQKPDAPFAEIPCKINYEYNGDRGGYTFIATVKKDNYSSADQLRGKAERRAKKSLYEYLTGCDFGEADEDSGQFQASSQQISIPAAAMQPQSQTKAPEFPQGHGNAGQQQPSQQQVMNQAAQQMAGSWRQATQQQPQQQGPAF